jgi:hypothetical protein
VLDEERKSELLNTFQRLSSTEATTNLPRGAAELNKQEDLSKASPGAGPVLVASIHEGSTQEFLRTEIYKAESEFLERIQRKYLGDEMTQLLEQRPISATEVINTLLTHLKSEMHISWEQTLGSDYREILGKATQENTSMAKNLSLVAFLDTGVKQPNAEVSYHYLFEMHKDNGGKFFEKVTELGLESSSPGMTVEFREISAEEAMRVLSKANTFKFVIKPEEAFGKENLVKWNELRTGKETPSIAVRSNQVSMETSPEISL